MTLPGEHRQLSGQHHRAGEEETSVTEASEPSTPGSSSDSSDALVASASRAARAGAAVTTAMLDKIHYHLLPRLKQYTERNSEGEDETNTVIGVEVRVSRETKDKLRIYDHSSSVGTVREDEGGPEAPYSAMKWRQEMAGLLKAVEDLTASVLSSDKHDGRDKRWSRTQRTNAAKKLKTLINASPEVDASQFTVHSGTKSLKAATEGGRRLMIQYGIGETDWLLSVSDIGRVPTFRPMDDNKGCICLFYTRLDGVKDLPSQLKRYEASLCKEYESQRGQLPDVIDNKDTREASLLNLCGFYESDAFYSIPELICLETARGEDDGEDNSHASQIRATLIDYHLQQLQQPGMAGSLRAMRFKVFAGPQSRNDFRAADRVVVSDDAGTKMAEYAANPWRDVSQKEVGPASAQSTHYLLIQYGRSPRQ